MAPAPSTLKHLEHLLAPGLGQQQDTQQVGACTRDRPEVTYRGVQGRCNALKPMEMDVRVHRQRTAGCIRGVVCGVNQDIAPVGARRAAPPDQR